LQPRDIWGSVELAVHPRVASGESLGKGCPTRVGSSLRRQTVAEGCTTDRRGYGGVDVYKAKYAETKKRTTQKAIKAMQVNPEPLGLKPDGTFFYNPEVRRVFDDDVMEARLRATPPIADAWLDCDDGLTRVWLTLTEEYLVKCKDPFKARKQWDADQVRKRADLERCRRFDALRAQVTRADQRYREERIRGHRAAGTTRNPKASKKPRVSK